MTPPETPSSAAGFRTVAARVREWAERAPDAVVMREKDFGIWQEITWLDYWELVQDAAHGLLALGVEPGDRVSIHSEDRPEWMILDMATVAIRGITVGLYPTNPPAEVQYLLADSGSVVHFAEDQEQVDKWLEVSDAVPRIRKVLYAEPRGVVKYDDDRLLYWEDFLDIGRRHRAEHGGEVARLMSEAQADDIMTLVYTSGTTGPPKGAMLSNANAEYAIQRIVDESDRLPDGVPIGPDDEILTYLPLCHVAERVFSTWTVVGTGAVANFAESIDTVQVNLREVQPTIFFAVPRIWEKIHAGILIKSEDATWFKRLMLGRAMKAAQTIGRERVANGGNYTTKGRLLNIIWWPLVFRALLDRIGLRRTRYAATGAAPIAPEVLQFFLGIGVPVYELYGMTENAAVATSNFAGRMKLGTVGEPYPGIGLRIDATTGEIQTKHPGNFMGYWNKPEATAETFTEDGWLKTGDVGVWVDGTHVKIVDRIKHIIITAGGKNISPSEIENKLKTSPYVREAMVIGDRRKYLTALIGIELDTVGNWALRKGIPYTTYRDLSEKEEVIALIQGVVNETNEHFARVEHIRKFKLIPKELDHEDGELTATQKVKRSTMEDMFGDLVEDMYGSRE
jgi:long-chain acyl-CoA synthetase